jgi:ligand-binding sensor domain-containing protein
LYSQKLDFENIGVRNGLPASEVYHVFEDKYGYIWFFTEFGIVKYTGSRMIPVCTNLSLDQTAIYAVAESPSGNMYISNSKNRIYRIHNDKAYRVRGKELDKLVKKQVPIGELITRLFFDSNGTLWANAIDYTYQFKFSSFRTVGLPEEKPKKVQIFSTFITKSKSSRKLFAVGKTVLEWKEGKVIGSNNRVDTRLFKNLMGNNNCLGRLPSCTGRFGIYCASNSVIQAVNFNGKKFTANLGREILSMNASPNGHIWVGTVRGLVELDRDLKQLNTYFDNLAISDVIFDRSNGMWVTTIGYGIFHCDNVDQLSYSNVIKKDERISTLKVLDKQLLIGTYSGKVFFNDRNGLYKMQIPENLIGINDVVKVRGTYYLGTMSGIFRFTDKNDFSEVYKKHAFTNYGIANYDDQNLIIISGQAIGRYEMETGEFYFFKTGKSRGALKRVNGEVLSVTDLGVAVVHINGVKFPDYLKSLKSLPITQMRLDRAGNVWFCAKDQGLYRLDQKNKITHIKLPASTIVKNILFVSNGAVIVATNQGAFVTDLKGLGKQESWRKIIKDEITAIEEYDNKVYFGSKTGLFSIANSRLKLTTSPAFFLRTIRTSKDTLSKNQHVLERNQNELVFHYDYLDFRQKTRMLRYHLKGPAPENGIVNGTEVHLQNLDPGDYTLETYPVIDGRGENEKKIITRFTIKPAVWETFTFQIIMLLLFSLVIVLIYRWILSRKLKQKKARESMERMLTEYRLTALKSQINPHFMSNSLVAIQNLILQNDTDSANLYIAKFSLLLRSLLDYSNKSAASLKSELAMIELYVELEQLRFSNKFEFKIDIASDVDVNDTFIPTLITQPFIENAIWHGLLPLSNETAAKLTLGVRMNNRSLIISIIDNGVGRGYHKDKRIARVSKGTELIAARIETLNQLYETTGGKIEITDLKDENGMPLGTLVTIELPESILNELYEDKES